MKFTYDFDIDDWNSFQRYHFSESPTYIRMRNITRILFPVAALLLVLSRFLKQGFDPLLFGIFAGFSAAWFTLYPRWFDRKAIKWFG